MASFTLRTFLSTLCIAIGAAASVVACAPDLEFEKDHCLNEETDGDETDLNCGGESCDPCSAGQSCAKAEDCQSQLCSAGTCIVESCDDDIPNGLETDVDCGGPDPDCARCEDGQDCKQNGDCRSNICTDAGTCGTEPTCEDQVVNGGETDEDCGGSTSCARCGVGKLCEANSDCKSGLCADTGLCEAIPTCDDGIQNGDETDRDCGGSNPDCPRCAPGGICERGGDCDTGVCTDGHCDITCSAGTANCDDDLENGCETSISGDVDNCGACDNVCNLPHASAVCNDGNCGIEFIDGVKSCQDGWGDCDNEPENGCETNLRTSVEHCGICDSECSVLGGNERGTPYCDAGACSATCTEPYADCEPDPITTTLYECETNLESDPDHCSECENACPEGASAAVCRNGICGYSTCDYPTEDCDLTDPDCEADLTSVTTCGDCATSCAPQNVVTALCTTSGCDYDDCRNGYGDCDGNRANGCEENLQSSNAHCGACGSVCPRDGTNVLSATCVAGVCEWGSCASGYDDCDTSLTNGCETDVNAVTNCGGCDLACSSTGIARTCSGGECTGECLTDRADCNDDKRADGCEVNTATSIDHCGGCGQACSTSNITATCSAGSCNGSCSSNYRDCNSDKRTDGCEVNINTSARNCGACGDACSTTGINRSCVGGSCEEGECQPDRLDCNNDKRTDGCEVNRLTDADNCGSCNTVCADLTPTCTNGSCSGALRVTYTAGDFSDDGHTGDNQISFATALCNDGSAAVTLASVRLRYWMSLEGQVIGTQTGGTVLHDSTYAYDYIEIPVPNGSLDPGACTSISVSVMANSGNFVETDDFSRPSPVTSGRTVDNDRITIYQNNTFIQGQRPPLP